MRASPVIKDVHVDRAVQGLKPVGVVKYGRDGGWRRGVAHVNYLDAAVIKRRHYGIRAVINGVGGNAGCHFQSVIAPLAVKGGRDGLEGRDSARSAGRGAPVQLLPYGARVGQYLREYLGFGSAGRFAHVQRIPYGARVGQYTCNFFGVRLFRCKYGSKQVKYGARVGPGIVAYAEGQPYGARVVQYLLKHLGVGSAGIRPAHVQHIPYGARVVQYLHDGLGVKLGVRVIRRVGARYGAGYRNAARHYQDAMRPGG